MQNRRAIISFEDWQQQIILFNKIDEVKYREGTSVANYLNEMQEIVDQLSEMGIKFDDEVLAS